VSEETPIRPEEAAAAAMAAAHVLRIVAGDPAMNDEALAAEVALAASGQDRSEQVQGDLEDIRSEDFHVVMNGTPDHRKPTS
jgi:metal-dependent amidase/aminoacylase/carboxypeptidase family protein